MHPYCSLQDVLLGFLRVGLIELVHEQVHYLTKEFKILIHEQHK